MSFISPDDERLFVQLTSPWAATIPNTSGASTVASGDGIQHIRANLRADSNLVPTRVKTGSLGQLARQRGRRTCNWEVEIPLRGSGTPGTASDMDPFIAALFGAAGSVTPSTSITYSIAEVIAGLTLFKFRDPAGTNIWNEILAGGVVNEFEISGGDEAECSIILRGQGVDVIDKPNFASLTTAEKRGLTSFPAEPSAPSFLSLPALAFVGSVTINGVSTFKLERFRIYGNMARSIRYAFGEYAATVPIGTRRVIGVDFSLYEEDTADQAALRHLARTKGTFDATFVIGATAGNIHTFNLNNLSTGSAEVDESDAQSIIRFSGCEASMTSATANDELTYVAT